MAQQLVLVGSAPNDGTGDPLRNAYIKLNSNETELYTFLDRAIKTITKNSHGFVAGNVLYVDNSGILQKVTNTNTQIPIGIVQNVIDANNFQIVESGYTTGLSGLVAGTVYYVQNTGVLGTSFSNFKYFIADSASSGYVIRNNGGLTIPGIAGSVLFIDGLGNIAQDNPYFYYNSAAHLLSVFTNGDFTGTDAINVYNEIDAYKPNSSQGTVGSGTEAGYTASTSRGTGPLPVVSNTLDLVGGFSGWAYTGASPAYTAMAGMWITAIGASSSLGGQLDFWTKIDNGVLTKRMTIDNSGNVTIASLNTLGVVHASAAGLLTSSLIVAADVTTNTLTYNKIQQASTVTLLGNPTVGTANVQEITLGSGLSFSGGTLTATGGNAWLIGGNTLTGNSIIGDISATGFTINLQTKGVTRYSVDNAGNSSFTQGAQSASWGKAILFTPGAHTSLTAATEFIDYDFALNRSEQWLAGTTATQRQIYVRGVTLTGASATATFTSAYSLYIDSPVAGTNASIGTAYALGVNGRTIINGILTVSNLGTATASTLNLMTTGGTKMTIDQGGLTTIFPANLGSLWGPTLSINPGSDFSKTASTEFLGAFLKITAQTQQWNTGALTTQRFVYFGVPTISFVGASTATNVYNTYIEAPIAGTNATITNAWALGVAGNINVLQQVSTSGTPTGLLFTGAAHTTITASVEAQDIYFNLNRTVQFSTGALTIQRGIIVSGATYGFVGASTLTDAATMSINQFPNAGTNATITNSHGFLVGIPTGSTVTGTVTNSYALSVYAATGATNNYSAQFQGGIGIIFRQASQSVTHNFIDILQSAHTGGNPFGINYVAGAHTGLGTSSTNPDVRLNLTRTVQFAGSATISTSVDGVYVGPAIYAFASAGGVITNAVTLHIGGPPYGGTNSTVTNAHGIYVDPLTLSHVTNGYGATINAPNSATNNYSAQFLGGNVGIGLSAPTGLLTLAGGTTTIPPFLLTSGTNLTTAVAGAIEYDGILPYFTPSGTTRKTIACYQVGRATAQTAANASVVTWTVGANDGSFIVSANVLVTISTTHSFTVTCTYTDEGNTSRTLTLNVSQISGTFITTITNVTGASAYEGVPLHIRCKAATTITIGTTGTFTTVTYNIEGSITQIRQN